MSDEDFEKIRTVWTELNGEDLDALFARSEAGEATERDTAFFDAALIRRFSERAWAGEPIEDWILAALANAFMKVLNGEEWEHALPLPDREGTPIRPWREQRNLEIFCHVGNSSHGTVEAIRNAASEFGVSYETARAAYYGWRDQLGDPSKILKKD